MRKLVLCLGAAIALTGSASAETAETSPASGWILSTDQTYTVLLANWSKDALTFIYRICQSDGPSTRISTTAIAGQPVILAKGQCIDVATQGSVRLTRVDATGSDAVSGTYQFIHAVRSNDHAA